MLTVHGTAQSPTMQQLSLNALQMQTHLVVRRAALTLLTCKSSQLLLLRASQSDSMEWDTLTEAATYQIQAGQSGWFCRQPDAPPHPTPATDRKVAPPARQAHHINLHVCVQSQIEAERQDHEAAIADWERNHHEAVESAEQWKAFADKLTADQEALRAQLGTERQQLQVSHARVLYRQCQIWLRSSQGRAAAADSAFLSLAATAASVRSGTVDPAATLAVPALALSWPGREAQSLCRSRLNVV